MSDRKQAPKRVDRPAAKVHPDWFWSLSGGIDSTAAFLLTKDIGQNYSKTPVGVYLDTRIGTPFNRMFVEELCDTYGVILSTWRTNEDFREWLVVNEAPGCAAHNEVRNELKDRQASKIVTLGDHATMIMGIRRDESDIRESFGKARHMRRHTEVYPVYEFTQKQCAEIILRHPNCPINLLWIWPGVIKDCGCLCCGDPSELKKTADRFPVFAQRLREYEEAIETDGLRSILGWSGLTAEQQRTREVGQRQGTLPMCSDGCNLERDPVVVRAFKEVIHGGSRADGIKILSESNPARQAVV